jgi:O-antigen/teichoic acid export membrane protein
VANETFVTWWVGDAQFAGAGLTLLLLAVMLFRHLNTTVVYGLFCYGNEQRVALTTIGEGVAGAALMLVFVPTLGLYGVALGSLAATSVFSLSTNLRALARDQQTSAASLLRPLGPWAIRMSVLLTGLALGFAFVPVEGLIGLILVSLGVVTAYGLVMMPVLRKPPLGMMVWSSLEPLMNRIVPGQMMNRSADNPEPLR